MAENDNKMTVRDLIERILARIILLLIDAILLNAALTHFKIIPQDNVNVFYILFIIYALK